MNSIRKKITIGLMATVLVSLLAVGVTSTVFNFRSTLTTIEMMMSETAVLAAERVEQELTAYKNVAMDTGRITQLSDPTVSTEVKRNIMDNIVSLHGFTRSNLLDSDGISIFDGKDFSDRDYVQQAKQGNVCVSEPLISKVTGEMSIIVAAPLYNNSRVVGVVYFVPPETFLNDIVSSIHIGKNCRSYMINKNGDTIADITLDTITTQNVEQEYQRGDSSLKSRAAIHTAMRNGESGFGSIQASDGPRFLAYAPVNGTDGWSLAVAVPKASYLSDTYFGMAINVAVIAAAILASIAVAVKLSASISGPMRACVERMRLLVEGDLDAPVPQAAGQDETAELTQSTADMVNLLNTIINDVGYLLNAMANKNFDIQSSYRDSYVGGYQNILLAMRNLKISLSGTIRRIDSSSSQVASASGQVSTGAQSLSQGAVEQASAVEELGATINDISASAKQTSEAAGEAGQYVNEVSAQLGVSVGYVRELNEAMGKISTSSQEISKIIATIENIAFQTNILALNAAVEAARAGTAGKGFAVVADEVRNLATKSDQAAKATKDLISDSIDAVTEGGQAVGKVTTALEHTHSIAGLVTEKMDTVVAAVESQTNSLLQVSDGIGQISAVVQTNSATAQESAAASEELNAEAASLKQLVDQFTLASDV